MSNLSKTIAVLGVVAGLGVAALPLSSYAADVTSENGLTVTDQGDTDGSAGDGTVTNNAAVKLTIKKKLSLTLSSKEADLGDGSAHPTIDATVITNNTKGYELKIAGTAANGTATSLTSDVTNTPVDEIVALSGTTTAPVALATENDKSVWGFTVTGADIVDGFKNDGVGKYAGVTDKATNIATSGSQTAATGNKTTVTFGAALIDTQAAGTYTGQVTFTASDINA